MSTGTLLQKQGNELKSWLTVLGVMSRAKLICKFRKATIIFFAEPYPYICVFFCSDLPTRPFVLQKKYHQKINESSEHWSTKTCHLATPNLPGLLRHFLGWLTWWFCPRYRRLWRGPPAARGTRTRPWQLTGAPWWCGGAGPARSPTGGPCCRCRHWPAGGPQATTPVRTPPDTTQITHLSTVKTRIRKFFNLI